MNSGLPTDTKLDAQRVREWQNFLTLRNQARLVLLQAENAMLKMSNALEREMRLLCVLPR